MRKHIYANVLRSTLTIVLLCTCNQTALAQQFGPIDRVDVLTSASGKKQINIDFFEPVQYTSHSPKNRGKRIFIELRHFRNIPAMESPQQRVAPTTADDVVQELIYRTRDRLSGNLEITLEGEFDFSVSSDENSRRLVIEISPPENSKALTHASSLLSEEYNTDDVATLMKKARTALLSERNYEKAAALYEAVIARGTTEYEPNALEFLGITRERMGDREAALICYQTFLNRYPQPENEAERVRQRMLSVETAIAMTPQTTIASSERDQNASAWTINGSLYQSYLYDSFSVDNGPTETTGSAITTDADFLARHNNSTSNTEIRMNVGYFYDLLDERNSSTSRVNTLYAQHGDAEQSWWIRGGRQTGRQDGVLGRFDGVKAMYALNDTLALSAVAGAPVDSPKDAPDSNRFFAGAAVQIDSVLDGLDLSLYALEQRNGDLVDRRAIGTELRYFTETLSVFSVVDYDIFYSDLNIGMLTMTWTPSSRTSFNLMADSRLLPVLTTENSLQGQFDENFSPYEGVDDLLERYTDDEIYSLAQDRTAKSESLTLGGSRALTDELRLSFDMTRSSIDGTVSSGGVEGLPDTGDQYYGSLVLSGVDYFGADEFTSAGVRWSDTSTVMSQGLFLMGRLDIAQHWQIYGRLAYDQREWLSTDRDETRITPRVRVQYRRGNLQLETEIGGRWSEVQYPDTKENNLGLFGNVGYRYDF